MIEVKSRISAEKREIAVIGRPKNIEKSPPPIIRD